jgi:hypothetical protein
MRIDLGSSDSRPMRRLTLFLPERDQDGAPIANIEYRVGEACLLLCMINGGATRLPMSEGLWISQHSEKLVVEPVHIVYSAVEPERLLSQIAIIRRFIERFAISTNQDAVAVEFDDRIHFFRSPAGASKAAV